jgi:hypothetical protein
MPLSGSDLVDDEDEDDEMDDGEGVMSSSLL